MTLLSTMLAAAFVAGSCTVALAQGSSGGASGAGGDDSTQQAQPNRDADKNPTSPGANPAAGNTGAPTTTRPSGSAVAPSGGMKSAPASNTRADDPSKPAGAKDATGAKTGQGGSK